MRRTLIAAAILSISCFTQTVRLSGQDPSTSPVVPGIASAMRKFSEDKEIAGSVTLVATANAIQHLYVDGFADLASKRPLREDSIFWIASMTKPMTGSVS